MHAEAGWNAERFAALIQRVMARAGLSQTEIGRLAGVSRVTAGRWTRGEHRPDYDHLRLFVSRLRERKPEVEEELLGLMAAAGYGDSGGGDTAVSTPQSRDRGPGSFHEETQPITEEQPPFPLRDRTEAAIWSMDWESVEWRLEAILSRRKDTRDAG